MLMEAMRLSLLDQQQQQQRNGNRASSSISTPIPVLNQRPLTPSQPVDGVPASSAPQRSGTPEQTSRRTPSGIIAGPLTNSVNANTVSVGLPLSSPATLPQPNLPAAPTHASRVSTSSSSGSSAFANLRGRLTFGKNNDGSRSGEGSGTSGAGRHRRAESNPPPVTTMNGVLCVHGTATAFLQAPNASSSQQARSAPVSPRAPYVGLPLENEGVPSPVPEVPTESAKAQAPAPATEAGETSQSPSLTPATAAIPPPAPIPVPQPVEHPPATSN